MVGIFFIVADGGVLPLLFYLPFLKNLYLKGVPLPCQIFKRRWREFLPSRLCRAQIPPPGAPQAPSHDFAAAPHYTRLGATLHQLGRQITPDEHRLLAVGGDGRPPACRPLSDSGAGGRPKPTPGRMCFSAGEGILSSGLEHYHQTSCSERADRTDRS